MGALFLTTHSQKNPQISKLLSVVLKTVPDDYQSKFQLKSFSLNILNFNVFQSFVLFFLLC